MYELVQNMGQIPPCDNFRLGHQNDGAGHLWCVLANTPHGQIPAKAKQNKAWYPFGGKEHETHDFHYVKAHPGSHVGLEKHHHGRPVPPGVVTGHQRNSGTYYMVICHHTSHGKIPGKSDGRKAWYSWGGREHETHDFSYVVVKGGHHHHGGFNPGHHHGGGHHHHGGFNPGHHHGGFGSHH
ncbi:hypothetical protein ACHWQZ_G015241 [Mnemiopsis leidyi]